MSKDRKNRTPDTVLWSKFPELKAKLIEALKTDHFFITVSCQKKLRPIDEHDLQHFRINQNYPAQDVVKTLDHIKREFMAKHMPNALEDSAGGVGGMF